MSRWNLAWLIGVPLFIIAGLSFSFATPSREREQHYKLVRTLVDVLAEIDQHYVKELDDKAMEKLVEDMINGGLERLDPYSAYLNPEELKQFESQSEGNFGGIGIQMGVDPNTRMLMVISPMVGTPAYEAGIQAGDLILKIDGKPTENLRISDAVKMIQGKPGEPITLTVLHEGVNQKPEDITIQRALIEIKTVMGYKRKSENSAEWDYFLDPKEDRIAYIRLTAFNEHTEADLRKAVESVQAAQPPACGLILDLRDNPGGLLKAAVEISDMFLMEGRIVQTKSRRGAGKFYEARPENTLFEPAKSHPIAILINKNSASASEIVAAALQDNNRAIVVGERSFGKGSVQKVLKIPRGEQTAALKLTTDTYWRPNGHNIHRLSDSKDTDEWGVKPTPGYELKFANEEERIKYMQQWLQYRRTRDIVQGKPGVAPRKEVKKNDDPPFVDLALEKAREALRKALREIGAAAPKFWDLSVPGAGA